MRSRRTSVERNPASEGNSRARARGANDLDALGRADLRNLLELAPDAMAVVDADGRIVLANTHASKLFGFETNELIGNPVEMLMPERYRDPHPGHRAGYQANPHVRPMGGDLVLHGLRKDGTEFPIEISLSPFEGSGERLVVAAIRDVTSRVQVEGALYEAEARFRGLFEHTPIGAALVAPTPDNRWLAVNDAFCELVGYTREELLQTTWDAITDPQDLADNDAIAARMVAGEMGFLQVEKRYVHRNGHPIWALVTSTLVRDDEGNPMYGVTQMVDITERRRVQQEIADSREQLAEAQKLAQIGSWEWDVETDEIAWSDELYEMFGFDRGTQITFDRVLEHIHPDDRELVRASIAAAKKHQQPYAFDHRLISPSGAVRWVHARGHAATGVDGHLTFRGTCQDVTEQRLANEELRRSEERLAEAQKLARLGSWEWEFETDAVSWSDELCRILGVDLARRPATYQEYLASLDPRQREDLDSTVRESRATGLPWERESQHVGLDGVPRWIHTRGEIVMTSDGRQLMRGTVQDVTGRKQAEERLREAELRYRTLVEQLPLVTYIRPLDMTQPNLYCSPQVEPMLGYSAEEWQTNADLLGQIVHPDDRECVLAQAERVRRTGEPFRGEYRYIGRDGRVVWVQDESCIVRDEEGEPLFQGYLLDITERKLAEEERDRLRNELHHAQQLDAIGRLAGGVAHDFNNMLTAIKGYGELLLQGLAADSPLRNDAEQIRRAVEQASELPKKLLAFSRKQSTEPTLIDLNEKVEDGAGAVRARDRRGDRPRRDPDARPRSFRRREPDRAGLPQLRRNARDAMPAGGALTIATRNVELGVQDAATNDVRPGSTSSSRSPTRGREWTRRRELRRSSRSSRRRAQGGDRASGSRSSTASSGRPEASSASRARSAGGRRSRRSSRSRRSPRAMSTVAARPTRRPASCFSSRTRSSSGSWPSPSSSGPATASSSPRTVRRRSGHASATTGRSTSSLPTW